MILNSVKVHREQCRAERRQRCWSNRRKRWSNKRKRRSWSNRRKWRYWSNRGKRRCWSNRKKWSCCNWEGKFSFSIYLKGHNTICGHLLGGEKVYEFRIWIETFTHKEEKQKTKQKKKKGICIETMLLETMSKHDLEMIG